MSTDIFDIGGNPIYPDIAVNADGSNHDIIDAESGDPNVSTPGASIQLVGWPWKAFILFSDLNRLFRMNTQWIRWFFANAWNGANTVTLTGDLTTPNTGGTTLITGLPGGWNATNTIVVGCLIYDSTPAIETGHFVIPSYVSPTTFYYIWNDPNSNAGTWRIVATALSLDAWRYKIILKKI